MENMPPPSNKDNTQGCDFRVGHLVGGKYRITQLLGTGGMGSVYLVHQVFLNRPLALKTINKAGGMQDQAFRRLQIEARATSQLNHPNLIQVHDFGISEDEQPYFVMDYVDGQSLSETLKHGPLTVKQVCQIFAQACLGLAYAHDRGIVHRDIKPSNIMLVNNTELGSEGSVKIVDFGIAKVTDGDSINPSTLTRPGDLLGSPVYMSPEQCTGAPLDYRSDIYSLGCVIFESLTGAPPHIGTNLLTTMMMHQTTQALSLQEASLGKTFPPALERLVSKMLAKDPSDRYESLSITALELAAIAQGKEVSDLSQPAKKHGRRAEQASPSFKFALVGCIAAATAIFAGCIGYFAGTSGTAANKHKPTPLEKAQARSSEITVMRSLPTESSMLELNERAAHDFESCDRIGSVLTKQNGQMVRIFHFPTSIIGTVCKGLPPSESGEKAQGLVVEPADTPLVLRIEGTWGFLTLAHTSVIDKIGKDEFDGLSISTAAANFDSDLDTEQACDTILETASHWHKLQWLRIARMNVTEKTLNSINRCKSLSFLALSHCTGNDQLQRLSELPVVRKLTSLSLEDLDSEPAQSLLLAAEQSPTLQSVAVKHTPISPRVIESLNNCKHINCLGFQSDRFDDSTIDAIASVKRLQVVFLHGLITPRQASTLLRMPNLIQLQLDATLVSPASREQLSKLDRRINWIAGYAGAPDKLDSRIN